MHCFNAHHLVTMQPSGLTSQGIGPFEDIGLAAAEFVDQPLGKELLSLQITELEQRQVHSHSGVVDLSSIAERFPQTQ